MSDLLHQLISNSHRHHPTRPALTHGTHTLSYEELNSSIHDVAHALMNLGISRQERVAVYLPKRIETVIGFFATSLAGGVIVPVNPVLKAPQVVHILRDCNARLLITNRDRFISIKESLAECHDLVHVIILEDDINSDNSQMHFQLLSWKEFISNTSDRLLPNIIDSDMAAILYTSGSTGKPKGVVLSQRNMVSGAISVASYLNNTPEDRILAVLPFSFDYGLSQLTTAFYTGACVVLMDYLLPRDVIKAASRHKITGLAAVPPLWVQLSQLDWPEDVRSTLRYITNSGGAMPVKTLQGLRNSLPNTLVYLMYGLTEAFRSTYLPPEELDNRPTSMGKAIPNAEIMVVREDGSPCAPGEPGELVHRGVHVALGYWNDPDKTAQRFRPSPGNPKGIPIEEIAVWSGDTVKTDEDGFLYFIGRKDDMIKTSGYRVSPTEIEEVIYGTGEVSEAVALGIPHPTLGQAVLVVATPKNAEQINNESILGTCKKILPAYMIPNTIIQYATSLPRNPNGKIDRKALYSEFEKIFELQ